jgi:hypothetical protein
VKVEHYTIITINKINPFREKNEDGVCGDGGCVPTRKKNEWDEWRWNVQHGD